MKESQCKYCSRHSYFDGKCYADVQKGRPIKEYLSCDCARTPKKKKKAPDQ